MFGVLVTGVVTLGSAFFAYLGIRDKKTRDRATALEKDVDELKKKLKKENEELRDQLDEHTYRLDIATRHIYELRRSLAAAGIAPPPLPPELQYKPPPREPTPSTPSA